MNRAHGRWVQSEIVRRWIVLAFVTASTATASLQQNGLHFDHVPIAVRDLESATAQFRLLGFTVKPGRPHQNGIENASIKFADGSYIELITAHDGTDPVAKQYEEFVKKARIRRRCGIVANQRRSLSR